MGSLRKGADSGFALFCMKGKVCMNQKKGIGALALLLAGFFLSSCGMLPQEEEFPQLQAQSSSSQKEEESAQVLRGTIRREEKIKCQYLPATQEELYFEAEGEPIGQFYVVKGDMVQAGELIAELEMGDLPERLREQEYQVEQLKREEQHQRELLSLLEQQGKQDTDEWKRAETLLLELQESKTVQQKKLDELTADREKRRLYAGISGIVQRTQKTEEVPLSSVEYPAVVIQDYTSSMFISETKYADSFTPGQQLELTLTDDRTIPVTVDQVEAGSRVLFALQEPDPTLQKGASGSTMLVLEERTDVLYVPVEYLKQSGEEYYLFVRDENSLRTLRPVKIGMRNSDSVEITEGVKEGETVLL